MVEFNNEDLETEIVKLNAAVLQANITLMHCFADNLAVPTVNHAVDDIAATLYEINGILNILGGGTEIGRDIKIALVKAFLTGMYYGNPDQELMAKPDPIEKIREAGAEGKN